jgi:hypothetical protein
MAPKYAFPWLPDIGAQASCLSGSSIPDLIPADSMACT